jgi:hypothetical protein
MKRAFAPCISRMVALSQVTGPGVPTRAMGAGGVRKGSCSTLVPEQSCHTAHIYREHCKNRDQYNSHSHLQQEEVDTPYVNKNPGYKATK